MVVHNVSPFFHHLLELITHKVLVDDMAVKLFVPAVVQVLISDEVADVYIAELACL